MQRSLIIILIGAHFLMAGPQADTTRRLWDTALLEKKTYRIATPQVPTAAVKPEGVVGITVWQLRAPAAAKDAGERLLVHQGAAPEEWIPSRVAADTRFSEGDRVRLSIEAARSGYLYVINREQYANGKMGDPYLIFPTRLTRGGNNQVSSGRVVEIPAQEDDPPYFRLRRSRPDQTGEILSVIVAPKPLEGIEIGGKPALLPDSQITAWEKSWGGQVGRLEMQNGVGQSWTKVEKDAGSDRLRTLKQDEPHPQSIYYRANSRPEEPVLVRIILRY